MDDEARKAIDLLRERGYAADEVYQAMLALERLDSMTEEQIRACMQRLGIPHKETDTKTMLLSRITTHDSRE